MENKIEERIVPSLPAPDKKIRIIIDSDAANEIDDLYAIALALTSSERFQIEGFVATHFAASTGAKPDCIEQSYEAICKLLELTGMSGKFPVKRGGHPMQYCTVPSESEGCDFIIEKAKQSTEEDPIWVLVLGAATNVASAILKDPSITRNMRCIFHARCEDVWPEYSTQYNIRGDVLATMALIYSDLPLVWFDTGTHITATLDETEKRIGTKGTLGEYLHKYRYGREYFMRSDKGFFDLADTVWIVEPKTCTEEVVDVLGMDQSMRFNREKNLGKMLRVTDVDCERSWGLLEERLERFCNENK